MATLPDRVQGGGYNRLDGSAADWLGWAAILATEPVSVTTGHRDFRVPSFMSKEWQENDPEEILKEVPYDRSGECFSPDIHEGKRQSHEANCNDASGTLKTMA
jgi:hypothetical protein